MAIVIIPSKNNINRNSATLALTVSKETASLAKENLLRVGDFLLYIESGFLVLSSEAGTPLKTIELATAPFPGEATFVWTWIESNHRLLVLKDGVTEIDSELFENTALSEDFGLIDLASDKTTLFKGSYKKLSIYASDMLYVEENFYVIQDFLQDGDLLFQADYTTPNHYTKKPVVETTMAPRDQSPILVEDKDGPLYRQYFFNHETGEYQNENTETFLYKGENALHLSYDNLDANYLINVVFPGVESFEAYSQEKYQWVTAIELEALTIGGLLNENIEYLVYEEGTKGHFSFEGNTVHLDLTTEQKEAFYGYDVSVTYQLRRSYNVEFNDDVAHDSLRIGFVNHQNDEVTVIQEGNRFSNHKLAREIELNPLVNARHTGFMYIDKEPQVTQAFRLNASSNYVTANGFDTADFIVEAIDAEGNEVLSPYIDVYLMNEQGVETEELGTLHPVVNYDTLKARNSSGRCYFEYTAPLIKTSENSNTQRVFAVAFDRKHKVGAQFPLVIRPVFDGVEMTALDTRDKTSVLIGEEVYTEKADNAVAYVEMDGKSIQKEVPAPDAPSEILSPKDIDIVSSRMRVSGQTGKIKSANLSPFHLEHKQTVWEEIQRLDLNTITVPILVHFENELTENMVIDETTKTKALEMLEYITTRKSDINIIMEPYPLVANGSISETEINPADINNFFYNWGVILNEIELITRPFNVYGMYIASNMVKVEYAEGYWKNLITALKVNFTGKVMYRKNWWTTASRAPETTTDYEASLNNLLFNHVDVIAISAYFELNEDDETSVAQLEKDIKSTRIYGREQNVYQQIKNFATLYNKPIFFGELGFPDRNKAGSAPWNPEPTHIRNDRAQANLFEAYGNIFNREPWFLGTSIFQIGADENSPYTPMSEAGRIIKDWFIDLPSVSYDTITDGVFKTKLLLDNPLRSVGGVADRLFWDGKWKIERRIGQVDVTSKLEQVTYSSTYEYFAIPATNTDGEMTAARSSHFKGKDQTSAGPYVQTGNTTGQVWIASAPTWHTTLVAFKEWVTGQTEPVLINYKLKEPEIEVLSEAIQGKLNSIATFSGKNYIRTVNALDVHPQLKVIFKSSGYVESLEPEEETAELTQKTLTLSGKKTSPEASVPFEYFARFLDRPLPEAHPVNLLDEDEDGVLTRDDLKAFIKNKYDQTKMQELHYALTESEVF